MQEHRTYIAIDLKSFYASVECRERGLNPLTTNLVVADKSRTEKTICLAVTPPLKAYGLSGRSRLFEVEQKVKEVNAKRKKNAPRHVLLDSSFDSKELLENTSLALDYIAAPPRMAFYIEYSTRIYNIYLKYVAPEDMHVYSIDEVFMDVTAYLNTYQMTAEDFARHLIQEVYKETGITATAGVGSNLYLCKIAMDIVAKHMEPDENGVRIASLDEISYRRLLWKHRPLTDFWRVGKGYAKKLEEHGLYTMGDIARCSLGKEDEYFNEDLLYRLFGVNAELLIDHAWGWEPCTIDEIKSYKPSTNSLCSGQVLQNPYPIDKARLVVQEMTDLLSLDLVDKCLVTDQIVLTIGYDIENLKSNTKKKPYRGEITIDAYGRKVPKSAHGTANLGAKTSSTQKITASVLELFDKITDKDLLVRRVTITANHIVPEENIPKEKTTPEQVNLFVDYASQEKEKETRKKERDMQEAMLHIKKKFGKNAILKGMNLKEGATAKDRNQQIGGHKA